MNFAVLPKPFSSKPSRFPTGRRAEDGKWYFQTLPFPINVFSALYDNRTSLGTSGPQIVIIGRFETHSLNRCVLWFAENDDVISVPANVVQLSLHTADRLLICSVPGNVVHGRIPAEVAPAWSDKAAESGLSRAAFRLPVEVPRWRPTRGHLALCLAAMFGDAWKPRQIVEWLEMQRLLGVERVVIYNRSMSQKRRTVFNEYNRERGSNRYNFVQLRQSHGQLVPFEDSFSHQVATLNDCFYRNIGSFRYIAVIDVDELIVPRQNFTTITELIDHFTGKRNTSVGSFAFHNVHYFANRLTEDIEFRRRLFPGSLRRTAAASMYLTRRLRASPSPLGFVTKSVINSDACIGVWNHVCKEFTAQFDGRQNGYAFQRILHVDAELAHKHHYRMACNFDCCPYFYPNPTSCKHEMQAAVVDDVMAKYAGQLVARLSEQYQTLKLRR